MMDEITSKIDYYISQAESLLSQVQQLRTRSRGTGAELTKNLLSEAGGVVGEALLDSALGRRLGKKIAKDLLTKQQKEQLALEEQRIEGAFSALLNSLSSFLSSISIRKQGLQPEGNSQLLLKKISKVHDAMRVETCINRVIAVLKATRSEPLIYNRDIPQLLEQEKVQKLRKPYETLKELETMLRRFIQSKLEAITPNWWKERIPNDVRQRAEEKKGKNDVQWPWHTTGNLHPIHYVDFTDYVKIITRRDNWEQVFAPLFKEKEIISAKLRELEPIRNAIAHSRELSRDDQSKLELYCKEIVASLRTS